MKLHINLIKHIFLTLAFSCIFIGCNVQTDSSLPDDDKDNNSYKESDGEVALIIGMGILSDSGYNQAAYEGIQTYALAAGISYSHYAPVADTPEAYKEAVLTALEDNAHLIICAGPHFEQAVGDLQAVYSDRYFLLLDGVPRDSSGTPVPIAPNVHCITYHEEEAGYLAGYMAVLEGYEKLGFIGGEQLASVQRYGYGYLQGINDAAAVLDKSGDISVDYWYADTFFPNQKTEDISLEWYQNGTQVIFACGGSLYQSILPSASACGGRLIGADENQNGISDLFLTSAIKGVKSSVIVALDDFYAAGNTWPEEAAGKVISYGAAQKCIELPISSETWRFKNAALKDYLQILAALKAGSIQISAKTDVPPKTDISVIYHNE
ncbi:MAG: BMP family ABC transporter substrate-binding protein [Lachnospiraceae bacterium]|nr:BMP family ABC transporter substrate-binding protein [Lachnospiraceae bacterium]